MGTPDNGTNYSSLSVGPGGKIQHSKFITRIKESLGKLLQGDNYIPSLELAQAGLYDVINVIEELAANQKRELTSKQYLAICQDDQIPIDQNKIYTITGDAFKVRQEKVLRVYHRLLPLLKKMKKRLQEHSTVMTNHHNAVLVEELFDQTREKIKTLIGEIEQKDYIQTVMELSDKVVYDYPSTIHIYEKIALEIRNLLHNSTYKLATEDPNGLRIS